MTQGLGLLLLFASAVANVSAFAAEAPRPEIRLRLDFRNLVGPAGEGELAPAKARELLDQVNSVWSACSIQFVLRSYANENAKVVSAPYPPQSRDDLGKIGERLHPKGHQGAVPLTIAGPWSFYDPGSGVFLNGFGWVFANNAGVTNIGAMMSAKKTDAPEGGLILAHELGHSLSLPEGGENTIMGTGNARVSPEQCAQARAFTERYMQAFFAPAPAPAPAATPATLATR